VPLTAVPATWPLHCAPSGVVNVKELPVGESLISEPSEQLAVQLSPLTTQEEGELHVPVTPWNEPDSSGQLRAAPPLLPPHPISEATNTRAAPKRRRTSMVD
jgi:hypothetical protein